METMITPSLSRRIACWLYEGLLMFGVVFISGYLFGTLSQTRNALDNRHALQADGQLSVVASGSDNDGPYEIRVTGNKLRR